MKKISRQELTQYGTAVISFLIVMTFTLLIFFWFVHQSVDESVQNVIQKNTLQQKDHLELVLDKEYEFLEKSCYLLWNNLRFVQLRQSAASFRSGFFQFLSPAYAI